MVINLVSNHAIPSWVVLFAFSIRQHKYSRIDVAYLLLISLHNSESDLGVCHSLHLSLLSPLPSRLLIFPAENVKAVALYFLIQLLFLQDIYEVGSELVQLPIYHPLSELLSRIFLIVSNPVKGDLLKSVTLKL